MRWNTSSSRIMKMLLSSSPRAGAVNVPAQLLRWVSEHLPATVSCYSSTACPRWCWSGHKAGLTHRRSGQQWGEVKEVRKSEVQRGWFLIVLTSQDTVTRKYEGISSLLCTCVDGNMWQAESWLLMNLSVSMSWKEGNKKGIFVDYTKYWFICW